MAKNIINESVFNTRVYDGLQQRQFPKLLSAMLARRNGCKSYADAKLGYGSLLPTNTLQGATEAAVAIYDAASAGKKLCVIADYDADGATSTAVVMTALASLMRSLKQAETNAVYVLPDRMKHGYGFSVPVADLAIEQHNPGLFITVDNGISSKEAVSYALSRGIPTVVTDHHDCPAPSHMPTDAIVIVNPKQPTDPFESKNLAGCGVIFYVCCELMKLCEQKGTPMDIQPETLLPFVAIGTIADVVQMDRNNRILVNKGIELIQHTSCTNGVSALVAIALDYKAVIATTKATKTLPNVPLMEFNTTHIAFQVAPRINAAGRLHTMSLGIECLMETNPVRAMKLVRILDGINKRRKQVEQGLITTVVEQLEAVPVDADVPNIAIFDNKDWHPGVIGIAAGRIKERIGLPVFVFAGPIDDGHGGLVYKGSARSIEQLNIRHALDDAHTLMKECLGVSVNNLFKYGGHAAAAGASIPADLFPLFKQCMSQVCGEILKHNPPQVVITTDGILPAYASTEEVWRMLSYPWGQGFTAPLFRQTFRVQDVKLYPQKDTPTPAHQTVSMTLANDDGKWMKAVKFRHPIDEPTPQKGDRIDALFRPALNTFKNKTSVQLIVDSIIPQPQIIIADDDNPPF
jgi:single-stranded-DNA-specific exonuclease